MKYLKSTVSSETLRNLCREDLLALFFLSLFTGLYALFVLTSVFLPGGIVESEETKIFILGWMIAPLSAILSVRLFIWIRRKHLNDIPNVFLCLVFVNTLLFVYISTVLNLSWQFSQSTLLLTYLTYVAVLIIPLINVATVYQLKYNHTQSEIAIQWGFPILGCLGMANFIGIYPFFFGQYSIPTAKLHLSLLVGIVVLFIHKPLNNRLKSPLIIYGIDALIIGMIILACFDPSFAIHLHQQSFYMGPVNRVMHGGFLLVDTFCQYGVGVIYFLSFLFKAGLAPFTYKGFSLIASILLIFQFCFVYILLVTLVKSRFYAILLLILTLLLGIFGTLGVMQAAPSTGPLRFGLPYMILVLIIIRRGFNKPHHRYMIFEYILVGLSSLWSFETFIYTLFMYLGICLFESIEEVVNYRQMLRRFIHRLVCLFSTIISFHLLFVLFTYASSKELPDWSIYFDFIRTYSTGEFGTLLIEPWSPWIFPIAIYFASLMVFLFRYIYLKNNGNNYTENLLIFGLTLFGIAQYTYFLGRSHPNNLYHISTPAVIITGYWFAQLIQKKILPIPFRLSVKFVFFAAFTLIILTNIEDFASKYRQNHSGFRIAINNVYSAFSGRSHDRLWDSLKDSLYEKEQDKQVIETIALLHKYTPEQKDVVVFLQTENTTKALIMADRRHRFPINDLEEDAILPSLTEKILTYKHDLKADDVIFVLRNPSAYKDIKKSPLQIQLIDRLCHEFTFQEVENTPGEVSMIRLKSYNGKSSEYCERIRNIAFPGIPSGSAGVTQVN